MFVDDLSLNTFMCGVRSYMTFVSPFMKNDPPPFQRRSFTFNPNKGILRPLYNMGSYDTSPFYFYLSYGP